MPLQAKLLQQISKNEFPGTQLSLSGRELTFEDIKALVITLNQNTAVIELDLSKTNLGDKEAKELAKLTNIKVLDISVNNIYPQGVIALSENNVFNQLNISANPICNSTEARAAMSKLSINENLKTLIVSECDLTDDAIEPLFSSQSIINLNLSSNDISGDCLRHVSNNRTLVSLDLSQNCDLSPEHLASVADNQKLSSLNITSTHVGDKGAEILSNNHSIISLWMSQCFISNVGAKFLAKNKTLEKLILSGNNIKQQGKQALEISSCSISHIDLSNNPCTKGMTYLSSIINKPKKEELKLESHRRHSGSSSKSNSPGHSSDEEKLLKRSTPPRLRT